MVEDKGSNQIVGSRGMTLGIQLAVGMAFFAMVGHKIHEIWGTLAGVGLGFFYGGYEIWKFNRYTKDEE